jgi:crotonobetainyl-CoA:carnitine CoA-transferase CaiB-like acyl-CoA transferase
LIWCAISSYGQTGPWRDRPGHDIDFLATAGVAHHTGRPGQGPTPNGALQGDFGGGTFGAVAGILAAVVHRLQTGEGQFVDVSMADGALWMNLLSASAALEGNHDAGPATEPLNGGGVYDYYATADGRYLAMGALEPKFWSMFCNAVGAPELELEEASSPEEIAALKTKVAAVLAQRTQAEWRDVLADVPCCVEPVLTPREAVRHPQFLARGMVVTVPDEDGGEHRQVASPVQFSATPPAYARTSVECGHDTAAVLADAGYDQAAIAALRDAGAIL